jgi:hypothetical protein
MRLLGRRIEPESFEHLRFEGLQVFGAVTIGVLMVGSTAIPLC